MAMGTAYNTTDSPDVAQWDATNTPKLRNSLPSIFIEHIIKRRGSSATVSTAQKWELAVGMICKNLTISAEIGKAMTADIQLTGQDMTYINALTSTAKDYTKDAEQVAFGSGGMFGNTILSTNATTTTLRTTALDASRVIAPPYAWFEQGFKYCYKDAFDTIPAEGDYTKPTNIRSWKLNFVNTLQPQWGLNADGRKSVNYIVPTERDISLDFVANYEDTTHYLDMIKDSQIFCIKVRMGGSKAIRFINGKATSAKYALSGADLIGLDTHVEFEARASGESSTNPYCEWVDWVES
jgi:hypothetical protein